VGGVGGRTGNVVAVDLVDTLRSTGASREFRDQPVPDDVVYQILDTARFAPSGGNRQGWRVVVVKDPERRAKLRDLYLPGWYEYLAQSGAGLVPWAPITDDAAEARAISQAPAVAAQAAAGPGGFAEHLDQVPVLLLVLANLRRLAAVDKDFDRYTLVGGASIYPFAWSVLLAARAHGLAGVMTTMVIRAEAEVKALFGVPEEMAVAALVALGYPTRERRRLSRAPVEEFTTIDDVGGSGFTPGPGEMIST
jgi:nitroreductase